MTYCRNYNYSSTPSLFLSDGAGWVEGTSQYSGLYAYDSNSDGYYDTCSASTDS